MSFVQKATLLPSVIWVIYVTGLHLQYIGLLVKDRPCMHKGYTLKPICMCVILWPWLSVFCVFAAPQMNAVRGGTVTWRPQPWQDGDGGGGEPLSDSDSEEEDFPDDSTTPLGDYITHGETGHEEARERLALVVSLWHM